ncbi:type II toxin-antitoxin system VapC family toxin [Ramlibacter sp.]|uniref:type II toxin-antitoxin system VapC family toxin n=1 Tax=Ramlibacter sp. TaxID=1917967 RepID=UPI003D117E27
MDDVLLDTGVLVALLNAADPKHEAASGWLSSGEYRLHTVDAVLTETSHFLPVHLRANLADATAAGTLQVHHPDGPAYKRAAAILRKYADLQPDWADAALVCLAERIGIHRIATLDTRDFSAYRIHGRTKFMLESLA